MRPVSSNWAAGISQSYKLAVKAELILNQSGSGTSVDLPIQEGSITLDGKADIRGTMDITLEGDAWVPLTQPGGLSPYGNEVRISRGLTYPNGTTEYVTLGVFGIEDADVDDSGSDLRTVVSGLDRARRIQIAEFEEPYQIAAGTEIDSAILDCVQSCWPGVPYSTGFTSTTALTLPRVLAAEGDDRWAFVQGLAQSIGLALFFDGDGVLTLKAVGVSAPVASVVDGDGGVLTQASKSWSRESAFNRVIATGENTDSGAVYRAVATDDDPTSPTYYYGPFGQAPRFYNSPYIQSTAAAQDAANAILAQELGTSSSINFGMVPNPALEPGDTVYVRRDRAGVDGNHILDSVTIGLSAGDAMSATTREKLVNS